MKTIWQFELSPCYEQILHIPLADAGNENIKDRILNIGFYGNRPYLWCYVDEENKIRNVVIKVYQSNMAIEEDVDGYIGSFVSDAGTSYHVFAKDITESEYE